MRRGGQKSVFLLAVITAFGLTCLSALAADPIRLECKEDNPIRKKDNPYFGMEEAARKKLEAESKNVPATMNIVAAQARTDMITQAYSRISALCKMQKKFQSEVVAFQAANKNATDNQAQGCAVFGPLSTSFTQLNATSAAYATALKDARAKLGTYYEKYRNEEKGNLEASGQASFLRAWGKNANDQTGDFSNQLVRITNEEKYAREKATDFQKVRDESAKNFTNCRSPGAADPVVQNTAGNATTPTPDATTPAAAPGISGGDGAGDGTQAPATDPNAAAQGPASGPPNNQGPPGPGNPPPPEKGPGFGENMKAAGASMGKWASDNKELLIVGGLGAAAVGGVIIYKNQQDKQEKKDKNALYSTAGFVASTQQPDPPVVKKIVVEKIVPQPIKLPKHGKTLYAEGHPVEARVDETLNPIRVTLLDENATPVKDEGIEISVQCTQPCSLGGVLRKKTVKGQVEFTDLSFSEAQEGVQLRFSCPGLSSVVTPGSFNVVE